MTDPRGEKRIISSPGLTRTGSERSPKAREELERLAATRERAHHRLRQLFEISRLLTEFEEVDKILPVIFSTVSRALQLVTAVLVEKPGETCRTSIFHAPVVDERHLREVSSQARTSYGQMLGLSQLQIAGLETHPIAAFPIQTHAVRSGHEVVNRKNLIVLPLIVDHLPAFGALQVECEAPPDELDLGFVGALANLIAVALNRLYNAQRELDLRERERKVRAAELRRTQGQVTDLELERELRNRFMATLTHDLRTPLTSARLSAELVIRQPEDANTSRKLAENIRNNIDRVDSMIQDLLDSARIRSGEPLPLKIEECDLHQVAASCLKEFSDQFGDRFRLETSEQDATGVWGYWSCSLLRRVIENLVNNAVKYGLPGRPIAVSLRRTEQEVEIAVHNEGNPLSLEEQETLFQPFSRTRSARASGEKGWGLGLTLVRGAAEAHGGRVTVESGPRRGTRFIVTIPRDSRPFRS